jgi:hypothetical protein
MKKFLLIASICALPFTMFAQDAARNWTVQLTAVASADPAEITLNMAPNASVGATTYRIFRKLKGTDGWGVAIASIPSASLSYTDETVEIGVSYEYQVQLTGGVTLYGWGYINSGIELELNPNKGDLLLLVDETFETSLSSEIAVLEQDLYADGWMVTTLFVDPAASASEVKNEILTQNDVLPNLQGLYLLGHVPVPYSGDLYPDAHTDHKGAWPADVYYADLDGNWTDVSVNNTEAGSVRNHNIPGDGKFDQSRVPSAVELQVSRVDFHDLTVFAEDEEELLRNYLNKAHEFKTAEYVPTERGLIDQGGFTGMPEGFAQNGFRNFVDFFGASEVYELDYWSTLNGNDYLWSYGCGAGGYTSVADLNAGGSLNSTNIAAGFGESTFTMLFGSYFGDWDVQNNVMRTVVANGRTLTCSWAGRPNWHYHTMATGENIGYAVRQSQALDSDYGSLVLGDGTFVTGEGVHVAQIGDPSLRMYYIIPPTEVLVENDVTLANLTWTASADGTIDGYNIYRRTENGLWSKLNTEIVTGTSFVDESITEPETYIYLVKAVKLKTNASGTFYNESLGSIGITTFYADVNAIQPIEFAIYPNPSNGIFRVKANTKIDLITVIGIDGQVIYSGSPASIVSDINLDQVESGVYFVTITSNGQQLTQRVVIY